MLTAAALTFSLANGMPVTAEDPDLDLLITPPNHLHVETLNAAGETVNTEMKLIDSNGVCQVKFGTPGFEFLINETQIEVDKPYKTDYSFSIPVTEILQYIPSGLEFLRIDNILSSDDLSKYDLSVAEGTSSSHTMYLKNKHDTTALTVPVNTIGIYADDAIASKTVDLTFSMDDTVYAIEDSLLEDRNIAFYPYINTENHPEFSMNDPNSSLSYGSLDYDRSVDKFDMTGEETEYVLYTMHISELNDMFMSNGTFYVENDDYGTTVIDLKQDTNETASGLIIVSGSMVNAVVPDERGNIQFYAEKEHRYIYGCLISACLYHDKTTGKTLGRSLMGRDIYNCAAEKMNITLTATDFPETGTNMLNVPAGAYTIEFASVPDGYLTPDPIPVTVTDSDEIQNVCIVLEEGTDPAVPEPQPEPLPEGEMVYPEDNILNILVQDENGNLIPDATLELKNDTVNEKFDSDGSYRYNGNYRYHSDSPLTWYSSTDKDRSMYIPLEEIAARAQTENAFMMQYTDEDDERRFSEENITFSSGETKEVSLLSKEETTAVDAVLPAGHIGVYGDPKWESNSSPYIPYLLVNEQPYYFSSDENTGIYGDITCYDIGEYTDLVYYGLFNPEFESAGESLLTPSGGRYVDPKPKLSEEPTEYIKQRIHVSEISDQFRSDGTVILEDILFNPRSNRSDARCLLLLISGGMVNAVIPDEDGYVEFYVEKESRRYSFESIYQYSLVANSYIGAGTMKIRAQGSAADKYTDTYTAVTLPQEGIVLTTVPDGEYTIEFTDVPENYIEPEKTTLVVGETEGVQTVILTLEKEYILGDVNEDGVVDISDATLALTHYARTAASLSSDLTGTQLLAADIDGDGVITIADATAILTYYAQYAAGLNPSWN